MSKDVEFNSLLEKIVLKLDNFKDKKKIEKYIASLTYNSFTTRPYNKVIESSHKIFNIRIYFIVEYEENFIVFIDTAFVNIYQSIITAFISILRLNKNLSFFESFHKALFYFENYDGLWS